MAQIKLEVPFVSPQSELMQFSRPSDPGLLNQAALPDRGKIPPPLPRLFSRGHPPTESVDAARAFQ
jgi:hypothetical protein